MKAYLVITGVLFGLIVVAHIWRVVEEGRSMAKDPLFIVATIVAAGLCFWAMRLLRTISRSS